MRKTLSILFVVAVTLNRESPAMKRWRAIVVRVQAVTARRREVGIRMALGATRSQVLHLMVRQGLRPLLLGVAIGLIGARLSVGAIKLWLFEVGTNDLGPLVLAAAILGGAAFLASWIRARRAARVEPLETLRQD